MEIYSRSSIQNINDRKKHKKSEKTNALLNLINNQPDIDKIYLYAKGPYEAKYQYLINKREKEGLKHYDDPKVFIEYSNDMQDVYKNIEEYNLGQKLFETARVFIWIYSFSFINFNDSPLNSCNKC